MNIMYHKMNSVFKKCFDLQGTLEYQGETLRKLFESTIACSKGLITRRISPRAEISDRPLKQIL